MTEQVGFIGLGIMGKPMARNLLKAGYPLTVHNRSRPAVEALATEGATSAASPRAVAEKADILITMLPNSPDVEAVALGGGGIREGARPGSLLIDMSTISPLVSQKIAAELTPKGMEMLDAPVSGGEKGAIEGTLSIMVGGSRTAFERALPLFQAMGKTIIHIGPLGTGGFVKLANQVIVAVNIAALAEGLTLGAKAGVDPEKMLEALRGGLAGSRLLDVKGPAILQGNFTPGFKVDLHFKDLGLIMESSRALGVPLPVTALVQELFNTLRVTGRGHLDHSALITLLEEIAGVQVRKKS